MRFRRLLDRLLKVGRTRGGLALGRVLGFTIIASEDTVPLVVGLAKSLDAKARKANRKDVTKVARGATRTLLVSDIVLQVASRGLFTLFAEVLKVEDLITDLALGDGLASQALDIPKEKIREAIVNLGIINDELFNISIEAKRRRLR